MGSTIYRGQCEQCGEERGWTYSHGYLTRWEPRREWDLETDPARIMVCVDCGSEHPVEGAISERESGRRPRLRGLGALALLLPVATALALLVPVVWDRRWSLLAAAIVVEVVVVCSLLRSLGAVSQILSETLSPVREPTPGARIARTWGRRLPSMLGARLSRGKGGVAVADA